MGTIFGGKSPVNRALMQLQQAATPDEVWSACAKLMRGALPVYSVLLGLPSAGITPMFMRTLLPIPNLERFSQLAPLNDAVRTMPGAPVARMSDFFDGQSPKGRAFFDEFLVPMGWRFGAAMLFWDSDQRFLGQLAIIRAEAQGDFTRDEMGLLRELHGHVEAAVKRLLRLEERFAAHLSLEHAIDALPLPIVIASWDGRVNYSNAAGREALSCWRHGTTASTRAFKPDDKLASEIQSACRVLKQRWEAAALVGDFSRLARLASLEHKSIQGFRAKIQLVQSRAGRALQPSFAIHFQLPEALNTETAQALACLSRLTAAEREVARRAAAGDDNADIARALGVSLSTARTHLRHIFEKLGITSRARLAPLFQSLGTGAK